MSLRGLKASIAADTPVQGSERQMLITRLKWGN